MQALIWKIMIHLNSKKFLLKQKISSFLVLRILYKRMELYIPILVKVKIEENQLSYKLKLEAGMKHLIKTKEDKLSLKRESRKVPNILRKTDRFFIILKLPIKANKINFSLLETPMD